MANWFGDNSSLTNDSIDLSGLLTVGNADNLYYNVAGDNGISADLVMNNKKITTLADPVNNTDAANKKYVDNNTVASLGDTMSGILNMGNNKITNLANPTSANDAVNKKYIYDNTVLLSNGMMVGVLNMSNYKIVNLAKPVNENDSVNKSYVDELINQLIRTTNKSKCIKFYEGKLSVNTPENKLDIRGYVIQEYWQYRNESFKQIRDHVFQTHSSEYIYTESYNPPVGYGRKFKLIYYGSDNNNNLKFESTLKIDTQEQYKMTKRINEALNK